MVPVRGRRASAPVERGSSACDAARWRGARGGAPFRDEKRAGCRGKAAAAITRRPALISRTVVGHAAFLAAWVTTVATGLTLCPLSPSCMYPRSASPSCSCAPFSATPRPTASRLLTSFCRPPRPLRHSARPCPAPLFPTAKSPPPPYCTPPPECPSPRAARLPCTAPVSFPTLVALDPPSRRPWTSSPPH